MITPVMFLEQTHKVTFMKSGDSNAKRTVDFARQ